MLFSFLWYKPYWSYFKNFKLRKFRTRLALDWRNKTYQLNANWYHPLMELSGLIFPFRAVMRKFDRRVRKFFKKRRIFFSTTHFVLPHRRIKPLIHLLKNEIRLSPKNSFSRRMSDIFLALRFDYKSTWIYLFRKWSIQQVYITINTLIKTS